MASNQPPATSSHIATESAQASLSALAGHAADRWLGSNQAAAEEAPTSSIHATGNQQTGTNSVPLGNDVDQGGFLPERPSSAAPDDHLCQHRSKPEVSSSASSFKSVGSCQLASPTSDTPAPAASLTAVSVNPGIDPQVAVLSVLAGVAADPASVLTQPRKPDAIHPPPGPQPSAASPLTEERAGPDSNLVSSSGIDIYDALREDSTHAEDWQVVKASRKGSAGSTKAAIDPGERQAGIAQQHGIASNRWEQPMESHGRCPESAQETANMKAGAVHVSKPMQRSSSQASTSSWASVDTTNTHDRYNTQACKQSVCWLLPYICCNQGFFCYV